MRHFYSIKKHILPAIGLLIFFSLSINANGQLPDLDKFESRNFSSDGQLVDHESNPDTSVVTWQGQSYNTVQIGNQWWLKENLNVGTMISGSNNMTDNQIIEKYCYDDNPANCDTYGGLYKWDEIMNYTTTEGTQGICPDGWHVPTKKEWTTLINYVSSQPEYLCNSNTDYIAPALSANTDWTNFPEPCAPGSDLLANNATGFSGLPTGHRSITTPPDFSLMGNQSAWWSSTEGPQDGAWGYEMYFHSPFLHTYNSHKEFGISVRCIKDETVGIGSNDIQNDNIKIYPNPTKNYVYVNGKQITSGKLYNIQGILIRSISISDLNHRINISNLPKGIYLLNLVNTNGEIIKSEKIFKE